VKEYAPAVVGVPEITPLVEFRERPAGRVPVEIPQVIGVDPVRARVNENEIPVVRVPSEVVVIFGAVPPVAIVPEYVCESEPTPFVAVTAKEYAPDPVGVPEITPVLEFRVKPAGIVPAEIVQVMGPVPITLRV
jgi:hypothetical protein